MAGYEGDPQLSVPAAEEKTEEAEAVVSVKKVEPSDDQLLYVFLAS